MSEANRNIPLESVKKSNQKDGARVWIGNLSTRIKVEYGLIVEKEKIIGSATGDGLHVAKYWLEEHERARDHLKKYLDGVVEYARSMRLFTEDEIATMLNRDVQ